MIFEEKRFALKNGRSCVLRAPREEDAQAMLDYLKTTYAETPYLLREPDEVTTTVGEERAFIRASNEEPRTVLLLAEVDGQFAGLCTLRPAAAVRRCRHRCDVGVALYRAYCGMGLGRRMMEELLSIAKELGFEQAELEVVDGNAIAIALYQKLGFEACGRRPKAVKYADGSYADEILMIKSV